MSPSALPVDHMFLPQHKLDISSRERWSRLPWKGQFTPELVDTLLDAYLPNGGTVLDPFAGSGTVLFESVRRGAIAYGAEVNDAALAFSRIAELTTAPVPSRRKALDQAKQLLGRWPRQESAQLHLWDGNSMHVKELIRTVKGKPSVWRLVSAAVILTQVIRSKLVRSSLLKALARLEEIVLETPSSKGACCVYRSDARKLPLDGAAVDLVITSPPYINVHNYHQYGRRAVELLGGHPLDAAKSEIGANRKFRQNRFLTVIQYAIDMAQVLVELRRVIDPSGRVVIVLGRESTVRGITFENGRLLMELVCREGSFEVQRRMERSFVNRFGGRIVEDILELAPTLGGGEVGMGRLVGVSFLREALRGSIDKRQRLDLELALEQAHCISASPTLAPIVGRRDDNRLRRLPKTAV